MSGATIGRISVLIAGFAGGVAGMLAMGAGAYIAAKSQSDVQQEELRHESSELESHPKREMEELVELFTKDGLDETEAHMAAIWLRDYPLVLPYAALADELQRQIVAREIRAPHEP